MPREQRNEIYARSSVDRDAIQCCCEFRGSDVDLTKGKLLAACLVGLAAIFGQYNFEKRCWIMSENVTMAPNNNPEAAKGPMAETAFVTCLSMQPLPRVLLPRSMPFPRFYAQRK